jgi:hypothetical protein
MKFEAVIIDKKFSDSVSLDTKQELDIMGEKPLQLSDNFFVDVKRHIFLKDSIIIEGIYCENSTIYGNCLIELTQKL